MCFALKLSAFSFWSGVLLSILVYRGVYAEELTIEIDRGSVEALPIAVVPFQLPEDISQDPAEIIESDLSMSGKFAPVKKEHMISKPTSRDNLNYKDWRVLGIENVIVGSVSKTTDSIAIELSLLDVFRGSALLDRKMLVLPNEMRKASHHISDLIYEELLGTKGNFGTKIAYITLDKLREKYRLLISDADGFNPKIVLESSQPLLSPAWSPDGKFLAYVSFEEGRSAIFIQNLRTGDREKLQLGLGINGSPSFSPDGQRLVITSSREGNPDLYIFNLKTQSIKKITSHPSIDTEGSWSPDGKGLVFTSDRSGGAQIYYVDLVGSTPKRVTFEMGDYNANAEYSADGKNLVMVSRGDRGYHVAILNILSRKFRFLSNSKLDESPSFSPNGDMVIYSSRVKDSSQLIAVSTDGNMVTKRFTLGEGQLREPAWGPSLD